MSKKSLQDVKVGDAIADRTGWNRSLVKLIVTKVHKQHFIAKWPHGTEAKYSKAHGRIVPRSGFYSSPVELWTEEHEQEAFVAKQLLTLSECDWTKISIGARQRILGIIANEKSNPEENAD